LSSFAIAFSDHDRRYRTFKRTGSEGGETMHDACSPFKVKVLEGPTEARVNGLREILDNCHYRYVALKIANALWKLIYAKTDTSETVERLEARIDAVISEELENAGKTLSEGE